MAKTIIIIDDDSEDVEIMVESVQAIGHGYECVSFMDACDALKYLKETLSIPDLIIIDVNMPAMSGQQCVEAIREIEKLRPALVAVYSSAVARDELMTSFERLGAVFFQKPSSYDALAKIFTKLLHRS